MRFNSGVSTPNALVVWYNGHYAQVETMSTWHDPAGAGASIARCLSALPQLDVVQAVASKSIHAPYILAAKHYAVQSVSTVANFDLFKTNSLIN
jgi:hypothetical protein